MPVVGPTALPPSDGQLPAPVPASGGAVDFNVMLVQVATDFSKFDPVPHQTTLHLVNNFVLQTTRFLNRFSNTCEEKLAELSSDIQSLEISLSIVEAKLDIQGLDMSAPPPSSAPAAPAAAESAPPPTKAPLEPEPEPEPVAEPAGVKVKDHARCAPALLFSAAFWHRVPDRGLVCARVTATSASSRCWTSACLCRRSRTKCWSRRRSSTLTCSTILYRACQTGLAPASRAALGLLLSLKSRNEIRERGRKAAQWLCSTAPKSRP